MGNKKTRSFRDKAIKCPFYVGEDPSRHVIRCEGLGNSYYMEWGFGNREEDRKRQMQIFCSSVQGCERCEMHQIIKESKYEG